MTVLNLAALASAIKRPASLAKVHAAKTSIFLQSARVYCYEHNTTAQLQGNKVEPRSAF
jgi:hypothetical protein